MYQLNTGKW